MRSPLPLGSATARALLAAGSVTSVLLLAACGGGATDTAGASSTASTGASAAATETATASASAPAHATSKPSSSSSASGKAVPVTVVKPFTRGPDKHLSGSEGGFSWDITLPTFTGSGAAVAEVNRRVEASAQSAVTASKTQNGDDPESKHTLDGEAAVTTNDGRTVQIEIPMSDFYEGAAHPTNVDNTVVLVAASGAPVTLEHLFKNQKEALTAFAPLVIEQAKADGYDPSGSDGLAPTTANWSAWQSDDKGLTFTFQDYQLGMHGMPSYTIPWSTVTPYLLPSAQALLAPTS
ncbi:RsiV family protein [Quadrisphaera granulorum]|uniref:RsiV family protein n=1 Tax=Quadrisphaera granulorum TaxID=317664 RepID=UPI001476710E|nr:RsiV family protein [Quadrisphaera granulorum]